MGEIIRGLEAAMVVGFTQAAMQLQPVIMHTVDAYLEELEMHIGNSSPQGMDWKDLKEPDHNFWYETGAVANHLAIKTIPYRNGFKVLVGLPPSAPGYQEAIWNEFGWHTHTGEQLVRRELFIPLGEDQLRELLNRLQKVVKGCKIKIKVKL